MSELIGINTIFSYIDKNLIPTLKRDALLLDRIAFPLLERFFSTEPPDRWANNYRELRWLYEEGLIFESPYTFDSLIDEDFLHSQINRHKQLLNEIHIAKQKWMKAKESLKQKSFVAMAPILLEHAILTARLGAVYFRLTQNLDAYAWSSGDLEQDYGQMDSVLTVVLNNLPIPDEQTSWEHIFEFRSDPDSKRKFLALKNWMRDISKTNLSPHEIEDRLEFLIAEYDHHMKIHNMKIKRGIFQSLIVTPAELLEDLIKLKWGQVGQKLFSLRQHKIALLEAEASSPGREVAFVIEAHQKFK